MMASGLVVGPSHSLSLPPPPCCHTSWKPFPSRIWNESSRRLISSFSFPITPKTGSLHVTACYSSVPASSKILANGVVEENSIPLHQSPVSDPMNSDGATENPQFEEVVDRFNLPEVTESYHLLEAREDHVSSLDPELQGIVANIADVERLNEILGERMKNIQELLGKTTKSLNAKAQEAKIEAAKLKKWAKLHQIEEIRRAENIRRSVFEARMKMVRSNEPTADRFLELSDLLNLQDMPNDGQVPEVTHNEVTGIEDQPQSNVIPRPAVVDDGPESVYTRPQLSKVETVQTQFGRVESERNLADAVLFDGTGDAELGTGATISESEECIVAHPGAMSCTRTSIQSDPSKKSAVITMETTVKCDGDACMRTSFEEDDYIALGVQTLAEAAQDLKKMRVARARDTDLVLHTNILNLLTNGRVVKAKPMEPPSKFGHESFVVELQNKQTGEKIDAVFKPGIEGNADGWHRAPIEMVAYKLNLMLGMDYIPPVVYKSGGVDVNYKRYHDGAFIYFVPNTKHLRRVPATNWGVSVALLLSDTRILDVLLNNSDRHHGHFLFGEHWADGKMRAVLIDHAAGFREEAVVKMDDENAFKTGAVQCVSARTYLRLRFLEKDHVASTFEGLLSAREVNELMQRRDMILSYLDNLVKERGYYRTVIES